MYILVRKDLSASQIVVQAAHAAIESTRYTSPADAEHPHLVVCGVKSEAELLKEVNRLDTFGISGKVFYEEDRNNEATAWASEIIYGEKRSFFRRYRLL